jgi:hypothetical protein
MPPRPGAVASVGRDAAAQGNAGFPHKQRSHPRRVTYSKRARSVGAASSHHEQGEGMSRAMLNPVGPTRGHGSASTGWTHAAHVFTLARHRRTRPTGRLRDHRRQRAGGVEPEREQGGGRLAALVARALARLPSDVTSATPPAAATAVTAVGSQGWGVEQADHFANPPDQPHGARHHRCGSRRAHPLA